MAAALTIEAGLRSFGAPPGTLSERINAIKVQIGPVLTVALRNIKFIRNGVAHEPPIDSVPENYRAWCDAAIQELAELKGFSALPATYRPSEYVREAATFDTRQCKKRREPGQQRTAQDKSATNWNDEYEKAKSFVESALQAIQSSNTATAAVAPTDTTMALAPKSLGATNSSVSSDAEVAAVAWNARSSIASKLGYGVAAMIAGVALAAILSD